MATLLSGRHALRLASLAMIVSAVCIHPALAGGPPVTVIVDMDAATPGVQSSVTVLPGVDLVEDIAVYVVDPLARPVWGMGYFGGIDRGIAFGHMPGNANAGEVVGLVATAVAPANPGNVQVIVTAPGMDPAFAGPEVQYVEGGAAAPAPLPTEPLVPLFTVDVELAQAGAGDVFDFYLLDFVAVWSANMAGAFSTTGPLSLDSGGDVVPDHTQSIYGVDPDAPIPVPPAAFAVDYVDGGDGPATIVVRSSTALDDRLASPAAARLYQNAPNPCRAVTTIHYELATSGTVELAIYDVQGRLIRTLVRASSQAAGKHAARWDGLDEHGRAVSSGVYLYRFVTGADAARALTRRLIVAR